MYTRLKSFNPFGTFRGFLPDPLSVELVSPRGETSSTNLQYPKDRGSVEFLDGPTEVSAEVYNPETEEYEEPDNMRFMLMKKADDALAEIRTNKYTLTGLFWIFRRANVWDGRANVDQDGKQLFTDTTPGAILEELIQDAKDRGWGPGITLGFDAVNDSSGAPWEKTVSLAFDPTTQLDTVIREMVDKGLIDFAMRGRELVVFNPNSETGLARDKRDIYLRDYFGVAAAPHDITYENLVTDILVVGDNDQTWEISGESPATSAMWGRLEMISNQSGVTDPITAQEVAESDLIKGEKENHTYTKEYTDGQLNNLTPFIDIKVGDWVKAQVGELSTVEEQRISVLSVSYGQDGITWHVTLGTRLDSILEKLAKRQKGLAGGATTGTSSNPSPGQTDWRVPTSPTGLQSTSAVMEKPNGVLEGKINVGWVDDGMGMDPYRNNELSPQARENYRVEIRETGSGEGFSEVRVFPEGSSSGVIYPVVPLNSDGVPISYDIRMRTRGEAKFSAYSDIISVQMKGDVVPPPVPSDLVPSESYGIAYAEWDGQSSGGVALPPDFDYVEVQQKVGSGGVWEELGTLRRGGSLFVVGLPKDTAIFFRSRSADTSGNLSAFSAEQSITVTSLVTNPDIQEELTQIEDKFGGTIATNLSERLGTAEGDLTTAKGRLNTAEDEINIHLPELINDGDEAAIAEAERLWALTTRSFYWAGDRIDAVSTQPENVFSIVPIDDAPASSSVLRKTGDGGNVYWDKNPIPFDPSALYRITFKVRVVTDATDVSPSTFYGGINAWDASDTGGHGQMISRSGSPDGTNAHYFAAGPQYVDEADGWTTHTGYFMGWEDPGLSGGGEHLTIADPGKMHSDTRYITPMALVDYPNGNGTWDLGMVALDIVPVELQSQVMTAQNTAQSALTMAGSKGKVFYDTTDPVGVGTAEGDLWRKIDGTSKDVLAEWYWDGIDWIPSQITTTAIANLDVGKLTVGFGVISQLVAEHIAGQTASFQTVDIKNLFVTETGTFTEAVINEVWAEILHARMITSNMIAVGDFDNLVDDGVDSGGSPVDWAAGLTIDDTDTPSPGVLRSFRSSKGQRTYSGSSTSMQLQPDVRYVFDVWMKADVPDSRFYWDVRDTTTGTNMSGEWEEGGGGIDGGDSIRPISGAVIPTTWTKFSAELKAHPDGREIYLSAMFFNHTSGSEQNAQIWVANPRLRAMNAGELVVDGSIVANMIGADEIDGVHIRGNAFEGESYTGGTFTGTTFQTDEGPYAGVKMDPNGIRAYGDNSSYNPVSDPEPEPLIQIGTNSVSALKVSDPEGLEVVSLNQDGSVVGDNFTGTSVNVEEGEFVGDISVGGNQLFGSLLSQPFSTDMPDTHEDYATIMQHIPRGLVGYGARYSLSSDYPAINYKKFGFLEIRYVQKPWRAYNIYIAPFHIYRDGSYPSGTVTLRVHHTSDGSSPTVNSVHFPDFVAGGGNSGVSPLARNLGGFGIVHLNRSDNEIEVRLLMALHQSADEPIHPMPFSGYDDCRVFVQDIGSSVAPESHMRASKSGPISGSGGSNDNDDTGSSTTRYTKTMSLSAFKSYKGSGARYTHDTSHMYHGRYLSTNGNMYSLGRFNYSSHLTTGSATIVKARVYVYFDHWYSSSGGTADINWHLESSLSDNTSGVSISNIDTSSYNGSGGKWITIPSARYSQILNGTFGVALGHPSVSNNYGYANPSKIKLEVTYDK